MIGAVRIHHEAQGERRIEPRLVHARMDVLDFHRQLLRALADLLGGLGRAERQESADALAPADELHHLDQGRTVAEAELQAPGVFERQQTLFEALHGERDGVTERYDIERVSVAELVGLDHGFGIVDLEVGAQRAHGLILRSAVIGIDVVWRSGLQPFLATERTAVASFLRQAHLLLERPAVDTLDSLGERSAPPVVHGKVADGLHALHLRPAGAELREHLLYPEVVPVLLGEPIVEGLHRFAVEDAGPAGTPHRDGLEILRPHHRAEATAAGGVEGAVHDARIGDEVLPARPDHGHADALVAQLLADGGLGILGQEPPQRSGITDGDLSVFDGEIDRLGGRALHDEDVVSGLLQLHSPVLARLAEGDAAAQRRFRAHAVTPRAVDGRAGDGAQGEHQLVFGTKSVGACRDLSQEDLRDEARSPYPLTVIALVSLFRRDLSAGEVHPQDPAGHAPPLLFGLVLFSHACNLLVQL